MVEQTHPRTPSRNNFDWWGGTPEGVPSHQKTRLYRSNRLIFYVIQDKY